MKKAILAVLIPSLLGATSAFAGGVDLIKNDDMKLNFNGDIDLKSWVTLKDGDSAGTKTEVIFDDIDFDFEYYMSDDLKIIAGMDLTSDTGSETVDNNPVTVDLAWVGFSSDTYGKVMWGNIETSWDPLGIDNSETDGGMASGWLDGVGTTHENAIRYDYTVGDFIIGGTFGITGDAKADDKLTQLTVKYTPGDLLIFAGIGQTTIGTASQGGYATGDKATYASLEVEYDFGDLTAAMLISKEDQDLAAGDISSTGFEVDVTYQATSKLKLATGFDFISQDVDANDDLTFFYGAAIYKLHNSASIRYELGRYDGQMTRFDESSKNYNNEIKTGILLNLQF